MSKTALAKIAFGLGSIALALGSVVSASAVTMQTNVAWVQSLPGGGYGISSALDESATYNPITADTTSAHTAKVLTSDGTYLYFADNQSGQQWQLVRTNLDGSGRLLLAQLNSEPADLFITGVSIYFSAPTAGLYRTSSLALGTPTEIITDSQDAGLGSSLPGYGYGAFAIGGGKVVMDCGERGLLVADLSFSGASNGVVTSNAEYLALGVRDIVTNNEKFYFSGSNFDGIKFTSNPTSDVSTWSTANTALPLVDSEKVYNMFLSGTTIYYTTGTGYVYKWQNIDSQSVTVGEALRGSAGTANFGVAVFQTEIPTSEPTLANTGQDSGLLLTGFVLLAVGYALRKLAK
ncbi:MAG: hypothetical protein RL142_1012 [Actinomycetota bacterium]|jgi:hypothetical protein